MLLAIFLFGVMMMGLVALGLLFALSFQEPADKPGGRWPAPSGQDEPSEDSR